MLQKKERLPCTPPSTSTELPKKTPNKKECMEMNKVVVVGVAASQASPSSSNSRQLLRSQMTGQQRARLRQRDRDRYHRQKNNSDKGAIDDLKARMQEPRQQLTENFINTHLSGLPIHEPRICRNHSPQPLTNTPSSDHHIPTLPSASTQLSPQTPFQNPPSPVPVSSLRSQQYASSPNSPQLLRSQMTQERRDQLRQYDRDRYKRRRENPPEKESKCSRVCTPEQKQQQPRRLTNADRTNLCARRRLLYENHHRQPLQETSADTCSMASQGPTSPHLARQPPPLLSHCTGAQHMERNSTSPRMATHLQHHLQSEAQRFGVPPLAASVNTDVHCISIDLNQVPSSASQPTQLQPMNIYDINFTSNWNSYGASTDIVQAEEEQTEPSSSRPTLHRPSRRGRHEDAYLNCARNFIGSAPLQLLNLAPTRTCTYCQAKLYPYETQNICCCHGRISLPIPPTPPELLSLYTAQSCYGIHFRKNIRAYNHVHAFTSMGVHIDERLANGRDGVYTYRAQGSIYHKIGSLLPLDNDRPRFLQMYIYDTERELENRRVENSLVDNTVLAILKQVLDRCNPYVQVFRQISSHHDRDTLRLHLKEATSDQRCYDLPSASQVAGILVGSEDPYEMNDRDVIVQNKSGSLYNLPDTAGFYDPLQYPLFHPYGSFGWDLTLHNRQTNKVSTREFYSYFLQVRDNCDSILLRGGRLLQQYVVDQYVKIATQNLRWIRDHQKTIRAELYQGLADSLRVGESSSGNVGRKVILPASYVGSPRDMQRRYNDAMALVAKFGKPDLFLTMTCNPNWPEIHNGLLPGQIPQDRPDIVTRVFRARCEELKKDLFKKHVLGRVIAHVHVIEFQKRGLPHAHFLLILDHAYRPKSFDDYDAIVRADLPDPLAEPELHKLVLKHMIHGPCGRFVNPSSPCMKDGLCTKFYPKEFVDKTAKGKDSYPLYRRPQTGPAVIVNGRYLIDSRWVVPYNPWLLMKYGCHLNVEICSSIQCVKYLYKYVYKGVDRVSMHVTANSLAELDEIQQFVDARWICPHEALWRIYAFPLNRMYPAVYSLPVHLERMHEVSFNEHTSVSQLLNNAKSSRTMLTEFFEMNKSDAIARQYLYHEFPEHYVWNEDVNNWKPRRKQYKVIGRLTNAMPSEGERYYLRVLLLHRKGPTSFDDLKTIDSIRYSTFKEAAQEMGLFQRDTLIVDTMREASKTRMPAALRKLFVTILVYCTPCDVRSLWDQFHQYMLDDYPSSSSSHPALRRLLNDLDQSLSDFGKSLHNFNLPTLADFSETDSGDNPILHDEQLIHISEQDLGTANSLNSDKKHAFNVIVAAVKQRRPSLFFIDGPAGTGKTFLYRALLATIRSDGTIALATASSGIAAIMMPGGRTAHSRFKIPIPTLPTSTCKISKQSDLAGLLRQTAVIVWDEASMAHRNVIEALDKTLQDLLDCDLPFGGKIVVLGGDFRQVLPVVTHGSRYQTIDACITYSYLWPHFQVLHLTENMRASTDPAYAAMLLRIGDGSEPSIPGDMIRIPDELIIPWEGQHSVSQLIQSVFPNITERAMDRDYIMQRALITPKNVHVRELNEQVLALFPGNEITYHSFDRAEEDDHHLFEQEFLNSISTSQLPPHKLTLKIGCPLIVLRNLDPKNGVCNGTRVLLRDANENFLLAEIMTGSFAGNPVLLPRIPLRSSQQDIKLPFVFIREQFPVCLSFALTINKSQGQTIPTIGIYLPNHVFSHGQLYVALSRSTRKDSTKMLIKHASVDGYPGFYTKNVVYTEVLHRQG